MVRPPGYHHRPTTLARTVGGEQMAGHDETAALAFVLAASRAGWGALQFGAPGLVDRAVVRADVRRRVDSPSRVGWRMKGIRDLALGVAGMVAPAPVLPMLSRVGVVVDAGDTAATIADAGRVLRPHVTVLGSLAGVVSVAIGVAASRAARG